MLYDPMKTPPQNKRPNGHPGVISKPITVLLAEDHKTVREAVRNLLEAEDDIEVVGEAKNGRQAVEMTKQLRPDVVVMDISMPLLNGLEATRQIHQDVPDTKVLILSVHNEAAYVQQAIELGAVGFLLKQDSIDDMPRAIREVQTANSFYLGPSVARPAA